MTTATLTLTEFLLARIAEDEAVARETFDIRVAGADPEAVVHVDHQAAMPMIAALGKVGDWSLVRIRRHMDPARVLAECAAKRAVIVEHAPQAADQMWRINSPFEPGVLGCSCCGADYEYAVAWPCPTLQHLAAVYADHPEYNPDWKP